MRAIEIDSLTTGELVRLVQQLGTAPDLISVFRGLRMYAEAQTGCNALFVSLLEPGGLFIFDFWNGNAGPS